MKSISRQEKSPHNFPLQNRTESDVAATTLCNSTTEGPQRIPIHTIDSHIDLLRLYEVSKRFINNWWNNHCRSLTDVSERHEKTDNSDPRPKTVKAINENDTISTHLLLGFDPLVNRMHRRARTVLQGKDSLFNQSNCRHLLFTTGSETLVNFFLVLFFFFF